MPANSPAGSRLGRLLADRPVVLADGAMGTTLFSLGLATGDSPELWNADHPDRVTMVHESYIEAGADIILTNSFGGTRQRLKLHGLQHRCGELNRRAAEIARRAADWYETHEGRVIAVAGSIGPTGELFAPLGPLDREAATAAFAEQAEALRDGGADCLWVETMSAREEAAAAVAAAGRTGLPVVCTLTFDTNGRTMMGVAPEDCPSFCAGLDPVPAAIGANCGVGPAELLDSLLGIAAAAAPGTVMVAKGNCGVPHFIDGHIHYAGSPQTMARYARLARDAGARIIGGCCGSTAVHVAAMAEALRDHAPEGALTAERLARELGMPWGRPPVEANDPGDARPRTARRRSARRRPA